MARLLIETGDQRASVFELQIGLNLVGRNEDCAVTLADESVSGRHCTLLVSDFGVKLTDLGSTNGTFLAHEQIHEVMLRDGETFFIGRVQVQIEIPDVRIAIPDLPQAELPGPRFLEDGTPACQLHPETPAVYRCVKCHDTFCADCVHDVHLRGERSRIFCPACSGECEPLTGMGPSQRHSIATRIMRKVRFTIRRRDPRRE